MQREYLVSLAVSCRGRRDAEQQRDRGRRECFISGGSGAREGGERREGALSLGLKKKCGEEGDGLLRGCREGVESRDEGPRGRRREARDERVLRDEGLRGRREEKRGGERVWFCCRKGAER
ncbi:hypothetical protein OIU78_024841 [Salix suchowensis]|nr:hypothetical protein OIU78_024841 [Salix suchowensis]